MTWKLAGSLIALRTQVDTAAPRRSRLSDGTIASSTHTTQNPGSDHEPWYVHKGQAYVTAIDITHDPANGLDCERLFDELWASKDSRIKYVIWNREITSGHAGPSPWYSRAYKGKNPHTRHLHLSVRADPESLIQRDWDLGGLMTLNPVYKAPPTPAEYWGFPVHDLYTSKPDDTMAAGVALEWAVAHSALAKDNSERALMTAQRVEAKVDRLLVMEETVNRIAEHLGLFR